MLKRPQFRRTKVGFAMGLRWVCTVFTCQKSRKNNKVCEVCEVCVEKQCV